MSRAPLWPMASLTTWTRTESPGFSTISMRRGLPSMLGVVVVDVAGVQHAVLALAEVDERSLHAGQDVADLADVDVADQRLLVRSGHVVLDQHRPFEHHDLGLVRARTHQHLLAGGVGRRDDLEVWAGRTPASRAAGIGCRSAASLTFALSSSIGCRCGDLAGRAASTLLFGSTTGFGGSGLLAGSEPVGMVLRSAGR